MQDDEVTMDQVKNNTKEQAMLCQFPEAIQITIIESMDTHNTMAMKALSDNAVKDGLASIVFDTFDR